MWNWKKIRKNDPQAGSGCPNGGSPQSGHGELVEPCSGFTLLEILIAVAILSGAFLALLSGQGSGFLASERAERLNLATNLARQKMAEMEMKVQTDMDKGKFPEEDEQAGIFEEPFDDYRWKYNLRKVEIPVVDPSQGEGGDSGGADESIGVGGYLETVMKQISEAVREIQLTVAWGDKEKPEKEQPHLTITTHVVKMK